MSKKLEQKQQRRALEEARQADLRSARRRRNLITYGIIGLVVALVLVLILGEREQQAGPVGVGTGAAGCGDVEEPADAGANHVDQGTPVSYTSNPPTSGDHWPQPADARFYPPESVGEPPAERAVHNLEHGQIVIWYNPSAPGDVADDVRDYIAKQSGQQVIALLGVPYPQLEGGNLAMSAWGAFRTCDEVSEDVIDEFRANFQGRGPEQVGVPTFSPE